MFAKITAISSYLPPRVEENKNLIDERTIQKLGIVQRRIATSESAGDLAFHAAEKLFADYQIDRAEIDFILLCVQHPDYQMPHTAAHLQHRLNLPKIGTMDISLGCSGYIYGLATAKSFIEAGLAHKILFVTSSVYSKYINAQDLSTRALFGDGATATLIEAADSDGEFLSAFVFGSDGSKFDKLYIPVGGSKFPPRDNAEIFSCDENKNRRSNYEVQMDGAAVAYFTLHEVPKLVDAVLKKAEILRADLDFCIFHQANKMILEYVRQKCGLEGVPFFNDIKFCGNLVSGSVPFAIEQVVQNFGASKLKKVLLAGFGVGFSWAGCIADLSTLKGDFL